MTHADQENRGRQIAAGVGILVVLAILICCTLTGWRYLPGLVGEWMGMMIGVATTPFFMEGSFLVLGLFVVVAINLWRRKRDGEELVYLEPSDESGLPAKVPDHAIAPTKAAGPENLASISSGESKSVGLNLDK
jgi:hypothetical protein